MTIEKHTPTEDQVKAAVREDRVEVAVRELVDALRADHSTPTTGLLTMAEAGSRLRVTRATLYAYLHAGLLPNSVLIGRKRLIPSESVEAFIDAAPTLPARPDKAA